MTDTYWWLLYALAGAAVAWQTLQYGLKHGADGSDLETESLFRLLAQHPAMKAFVLLMVWAIWPLMAAVMLIDGIRWLYDGARDLIDDALDSWNERKASRKGDAA